MFKLKILGKCHTLWESKCDILDENPSDSLQRAVTDVQRAPEWLTLLVSSLVSPFFSSLGTLFSSSSPPPPSHNQVSNSTKWMDLELGTIDCNAFCDRQVSADFQINCGIQPRELDLCGIAAFRNEPKDTRVAGCPIVATSCPKHPDSPTWCTSVWSLCLSCWQNNPTPNLTNWVQFLQNIPNSISKPFTKQRLDLITFVYLWQESFVSQQKLVQWV